MSETPVVTGWFSEEEGRKDCPDGKVRYSSGPSVVLRGPSRAEGVVERSTCVTMWVTTWFSFRNVKEYGLPQEPGASGSNYIIDCR